MKKSLLILLIAALIAFSMIFVSCTKNDAKESSSAVGTATVRKPVEINVGNASGWDTLSPFRSNIGNNLPVISTITYETLGYLDGENKLVPLCAREWSTADDGKTYDITIYDYITDSDGNNITASDFVWFIDVSKSKALKPNFKYVESAETTGDYSFKVKFSNPMVGVFETFMIDVYAVSREAYEKAGDDFVSSCVSTSPYKCTNFVSGSSMTYEKRSDYWQKLELLPPQLLPNVDKITYHVIPEAAQLGIALETGVVDYALWFTPSTAVQFEDNPAFTLQKGESRNGMQVFFSGAEGKDVANDKYLRQAICYAINNRLIIDAVLEGYGDVMHDSAGTMAIGYLDSWKNEEYYPYDVEKAKACLAKSNYSGRELEILATTSTKTVAEIIQNSCAAVGIKVKLNIMELALLTSIRLDGTKYDMFINQVGGITLANHWNTRYDARAYKTGDATSRKDMVLADLIANTSVLSGFTPENIQKVHDYIKEEAYGYGIYQPQLIAVWNNKLNIKQVVYDNIKTVVPTACIYN